MNGRPLGTMLAGTRKSYDRMVSAVCRECSWGCGLLVYVKDNVIVDIEGDGDHPANGGALCARGVAFLQGLTHPERIKVLAARNHARASFEVIDAVDRGFDLLAERLSQARERYGPESLRIECKAEAGLDFCLAAQRFAVLWGTANIDSDDSRNISLETVSKLPGLHLALDDWHRVSSLLLVETDPAETHPVAFGRILRAQDEGVKIIAADARFTRTLSKADRPVIVKSGSGNIFGLAILKAMLEEDLCSPETMVTRFIDAAKWRQSLADLSLDEAAVAVGISVEKVVETARFLAAHNPAIVFTGRRTSSAEHRRVWSTLAVAAQWDRAGGGWHPLEMQPPELDPATDLADPDRRFSNSGEKQPEEMTRILICGGDCLGEPFSILKSGSTQPEWIVYFGAFPGSTLAASHMVFPAALWPETEGVCFNDNGLVQWSRSITRAPGCSMSGLEFWLNLAERFGLGERFLGRKRTDETAARAFFRRTLSGHPMTRHIDTDALASGRSARPQQIRLPVSAAKKTTPQFAPAVITATSDREVHELYPLDFHSTPVADLGGLSRWSSWMEDLGFPSPVQLHPDLAGMLGIENGQTVFVISEHESFSGYAQLSRMVPLSTVWSPQSLRSDRVLLYKPGQKPEEVRSILRKAFQ